MADILLLLLIILWIGRCYEGCYSLLRQIIVIANVCFVAYNYNIHVVKTIFLIGIATSFFIVSIIIVKNVFVNTILLCLKNKSSKWIKETFLVNWSNIYYN